MFRGTSNTSHRRLGFDNSKVSTFVANALFTSPPVIQTPHHTRSLHQHVDHDVDRKTMSRKYRMQLNVKKDGNKGVQAGEKKLAGFINYSNSNHSMIENHRAQKKVAKELRKFYTEKWHQRNIRNSKAMKQRGLHMIKKQQQGEMAKYFGDKNLEFVYYYGHAGRGTNSRIKGFLRRGHSGLIDTLRQQSDVFITNEFRTTNLCCLCHQPTTFARKDHIKENKGTIICVNPNCNRKRYGCIARSRDGNASMNMIVSGPCQQCLGSPPTAFSCSSSLITNDISKISQKLQVSHPGPPNTGMVEGSSRVS